MRRKFVVLIACGLLLAGLIPLGGALMASARTWLPAYLIGQAWAAALAGEEDTRPWPWLDSEPVARLRVPRLEKDFIVMRGTSGAVLAFAPGWHEGTGEPGAPGISLISAPGDTHFSFLRAMKRGDRVMVETADGVITEYIVDELKVLLEPEMKIDTTEGERVLLLSTYYPFANWKPDGEMLFVAVARHVPPEAPLSTS